MSKQKVRDKIFNLSVAMMDETKFNLNTNYGWINSYSIHEDRFDIVYDRSGTLRVKGIEISLNSKEIKLLNKTYDHRLMPLQREVENSLDRYI